MADVNCRGCVHFNGLNCSAGVCAAVRMQIRGHGWPVPAEQVRVAAPERRGKRRPVLAAQ